MSKSLLKRKDFLNLLSKSKRNKKRRNLLIDIADKEEINALSEIILNALRGNLPLKKKEIKELNKYKHVLRKLIKRTYSIKKKKAILKQKGGFLGAIIPIALSALGSIFGQ